MTHIFPISHVKTYDPKTKAHKDFLNSGVLVVNKNLSVLNVCPISWVIRYERIIK